jgi:hypothetical protein
MHSPLAILTGLLAATRLWPRHRLSVLPIFAALFAAIHWISFSPYFADGTLTQGMTPLVLHGNVTPQGYAFSLFHAAALTAISQLLTRRI